jgi:hypothetical protein
MRHRAEEIKVQEEKLFWQKKPRRTHPCRLRKTIFRHNGILSHLGFKSLADKNYIYVALYQNEIES